MAELASFFAEPLGDPLVRRAAMELALIGLAGGALGSWVVLYGLPYAVESAAHAMLPGLVLAALAGLPLALGGGVGLLVGAGAIALASRAPSIGPDVAVAVAVTALSGLGALLALSPDSPARLSEILFGDVLAVSGGEVAVAAAVSAAILLALALAHPRLLAAGFDPAGGAAGGVAVARVQLVLLVLTAAAVLVAVQSIGNLLALSVFVGPAAGARLLTRRMPSMIALATVLALVASLAGLYVSYHLSLAAGASVAAAMSAVWLACLGWRSLLRLRPPGAAGSPREATP